jgi:hypothetical protein
MSALAATMGREREARHSRRHCVLRATSVAALPIWAACSGGARRYNEAIAALQRPMNLSTSAGEALREIVRYATLAASSHDSQPWKFALSNTAITVIPDYARRTPVVDPDDHHLFVSLGCATENLVHAARASGLHPDVRVREESIEVALEKTPPLQSLLFEAIPSADLRALEAAANGDGVHAVFLTTTAQIETVLDYVTRGNVAQIGDPAFVSELRRSIRFNQTEAVETGDGLSSRSTGKSSPGQRPRHSRWSG